MINFMYRTRSLLFCHAILTIKSEAARVRILPAVPENNMRGKFTQGNPQEFQHQISSHSETEHIRRASSSSRKNNGKKRVMCSVILYYTGQNY